jgi:hypothetical protein
MPAVFAAMLEPVAGTGAGDTPVAGGFCVDAEVQAASETATAAKNGRKVLIECDRLETGDYPMRVPPAQGRNRLEYGI